MEGWRKEVWWMGGEEEHMGLEADEETGEEDLQLGNDMVHDDEIMVGELNGGTHKLNAAHLLLNAGLTKCGWELEELANDMLAPCSFEDRLFWYLQNLKKQFDDLEIAVQELV
ncbi:hypothetical protein LTS10_008032 [Elasticomyces elasticus]|nr:hypothetical protein LTS10_008032 [Elasticomyces elasticus]